MQRANSATTGLVHKLQFQVMSFENPNFAVYSTTDNIATIIWHSQCLQKDETKINEHEGVRNRTVRGQLINLKYLAVNIQHISKWLACTHSWPVQMYIWLACTHGVMYQHVPMANVPSLSQHGWCTSILSWRVSSHKWRPLHENMSSAPFWSE